MSVTSDPVASRGRLPFTVYILAGLMLLKAALLALAVAGATLVRVGPALALTDDRAFASFADSAGMGAVLVGIALLLVASAVGMLLRRRTGWLLAMVITGLFVAIDIYSYFNGGANDLWQLLNVVTVFYLNQRDVREAVGVVTADDDHSVLVAA
jgi:hypothetical protein